MKMNYQLSTFNSQYNKRGFTLIELIAVIAIISILTAVSIANFAGFRAKGRDQQRKSDLVVIQSALEQYRYDLKTYPIANDVLDEAGVPRAIPLPDTPHNPNDCPNALTDPGGTTYTFLKKIPCDPLNSSTYYNGGSYYYSSDGQIYTLVACLENTNDPQASTTCNNHEGIACPGGCSAYYIVKNPK